MLKIRSKLSEKLNIPADIALGVSIVTITGTKEAYIENYKGIIEYGKKCIKLQTNECKIYFKGNDLEIVYYTNADMKITGKIESISYC